MAYPILAPNKTWYKGTTERSTITTIEIKNSYTPTVAVVEQWDASEVQNGSITCYVEGTKLTIAGNGSGKISLNIDSRAVFSTFSSVTNIQGLELFDTSNCTNFQIFFGDDIKLENVDLSSWNVNKITNIRGMFQCCSSLKTLNVSTWHTPNLVQADFFLNMLNSQYENNSLEEIDLSSWDMSKVISLKQFCAYCNSLKKINTTGWILSSCTDMKNAFLHDIQLSNIDTTSWGCENVENMFCTFRSCLNLETIDVSKWNVSKVKTFKGFVSLVNDYGSPEVNKLKKLDVSNWDTISAEDMSFMFYGCNHLSEIDTSNWNVSNVTTFDHFIAHSNLKFDTSKWKVTSKCTHTGAMFHSCQNEIIDISGFDFSNVITTNQMFEGCSKLKKIIGIEKMKTPKNIAPDEMFLRCSSLEELDVSNLDTTTAHDGTKISTNGGISATCFDMFKNMPNLRKITLGPNFSYNGDGTTTNPTHHAIFTTPDPSQISGADGKWYALDGTAYTPEEAPKHVPNTFFASKQLMESEPMMIKNGTLVNIGNGIAYVKDDNIKRYPSEMGNALTSIPKWDGRGEY